MDSSINSISQLGGTVFTVVAFLYYLTKIQADNTAAQIRLAEALDNLANKITINSVATNKNTQAS